MASDQDEQQQDELDAPKEDAPKEDAPKEDAPKEDAPKEDAPKEDAPKEDAPKEDAPKEDDKPASTDAAKNVPPSETEQRWKKWHSLSGAVVLGLFLVVHILTNASALAGQAAYDSVVGAIERSKLLVLFEIVVLGPLFFHAGYGIVLLRRGTTPTDEAANVARYGERRLWLAQRASAPIVLLFVLAHLWELRVQRLFFGMAPDAFHTTLSSHLSWTWIGIPWIALGYLLGLIATLFHFGNGLAAALAPRKLRGIILVLGVVLFLIAGATVVSFATGTRLLPGADADSAPCGTAFKPSSTSTTTTPNSPAPSASP